MMLWIYLLIGFATGFLSGLIGVGGGFILIPLLLLVHVPLEAAVGASLVFIFFSAGSGTLRHGFQGTVDWRLGVIVTLSTIVTTVLGSLLTARVPGKLLQILLGFCVVAGIYLINRKSTVAGNPPDMKKPGRWAYTQTVRIGNRPVTYQVNVSKAVLVGGGVGFLTGLLGVRILESPGLCRFYADPAPCRNRDITHDHLDCRRCRSLLSLGTGEHRPRRCLDNDRGRNHRSSTGRRLRSPVDGALAENAPELHPFHHGSISFFTGRGNSLNPADNRKDRRKSGQPCTQAHDRPLSPRKERPL